MDEALKWEKRFERERKARKEAEALLESKSRELWSLNQNLEQTVNERTLMLEKALNDAEQANKAKSSFLANMSHEIRTPLNAIIGFADILRDAALPKKEKEHINIIAKSGQALLEIINDVLDISKIESGNFELETHPFSLQSVCDHVIELFNVKAQPKSITLNYQFDKTIPQAVVGDSVRIQQVLTNLLSNAIKFTPEGGSVTLNVMNTRSDDSSVNIDFEVKDTGVGIDSNVQKTLFKPFVQADSSVNRKFGGTGLGLAICADIISMMGSQFQLDSIPGLGSSFKFSLALPIAVTKEKTPSSKSPIKSFKAHALVAEDNASNQQLIEILLKKLDVSCTIVDNGIAAQKAYENGSFDIIFMDINMPECDGVTACKKIRQNPDGNKDIPIIALTANTFLHDIERYLEAGMSGFLAKPIMFDALVQVLDKYLKPRAEVEVDMNSEGYAHTPYLKNKIKKELNIDDDTLMILLDNFFLTIEEDMHQLRVAMTHHDYDAVVDHAELIKTPCASLHIDDAMDLLEKIIAQARNKMANPSLYHHLEQVFAFIQQNREYEQRNASA